MHPILPHTDYLSRIDALLLLIKVETSERAFSRHRNIRRNTNRKIKKRVGEALAAWGNSSKDQLINGGMRGMRSFTKTR